MTDLLDRLRRNDPSALEALSHDLLPYVQVAVLAQSFEARDQAALHRAFREEVTAALGLADATALSNAVVERLRGRAASLPALTADPPQLAALARIKALATLPVPEREMVLARFVERLPGDLTTARFGLDAPALTAVLARGAALLCPGGEFSSEPSLLDPNALPAAAFIELENVLTCLSIDVSAFELNPVMAQLPVARPGFVPAAPQETYPSVVKTQGAVDLPAAMGELEERTTPVGVPLMPAPPAAEVTETQGRPLVVVAAAEATEPRARPVIAVDPDATAPRGSPIVADPDATVPRAIPLPSAPTRVVPTGPPPLHRKVPGRWWLGGSALCTGLGIALYLSLVGSVRTQMQRPWTLVPVVSAAFDLREGTRLSLDLLATRAVPASYVSPSVVTPGAIEYAVGQKLEFPLQAGDPVLWSHFDAARKSRRFDIVKRGRAVSTVILEEKAVGGLLVPNEEVDLLLTMPPKVNHTHQSRAVTLLQKVRVLAVGPVTTQTVGRSVIHYNDVTVMLVPEEVEVLSLARRQGDITASLRTPDDVDTIEWGNTTVDTLLSGVRLKALEKKRADVITIIRGLP